jgi:SOS response regulatory protein OraA/RecX
MLERPFALNVKGAKMNKIQKILSFHCQECQTTFQLLEVQQKSHLEVIHNEYDNCQKQWQALLNQHYQEQIILHLAQEEAKKEEHD